MALVGIMNRGAIVTEALQFGGNPALTTRVNNFLNLFLDHLYRSFDWEFLVTEASISSGSPIYTFTLPADYGRIKAIHLDGTNATKAMVQMDFATIWQKIRLDTANGSTTSTTPTSFAIEPGTPKAYAYPIPTAAYTGKILYFKMPAALTQDTDFPLFPDSLALVYACTSFVEAYERESLQTIIDRASDHIRTQYQNNHFDAGRASANQLQMESSVFNGWNYRES